MDVQKIFPECSNVEQTAQLNELFGACESYYDANSMFRLLPDTILYDGRIGYLSIGLLGIEWTALDSDYKVKVAWSVTTIPDLDIYDCFIKAVVFLKENNLV